MGGKFTQQYISPEQVCETADWPSPTHTRFALSSWAGLEALDTRKEC